MSARSRRAAIALGLLVLVAGSIAAAYVWFFVIDRVVTAADYPEPLPDGSHAELVGLRTVPPFTPWAPASEIRVLEPDGRLRWTLALPPYRIDVRLVVADDDLLLIGAGSELRAVDLASGDVLFARDHGRRIESLYAAASATRVFVSDGSSVGAFDRTSGRRRWSVRMFDVYQLAPFGPDRVTANRFVLDAANGRRLAPTDGFSCRTEDSLLTCDEDGCRRQLPDGTESRLTEQAMLDYATCFESGGLLVAMLRRSTGGGARDSVGLVSLDELTDEDRAVFVAWDADDRVRWVRVIDSWEEPCMLRDGRIKITVPRPGRDGPRVVHTRYYDPATGEHEHCVGIDDCPGVISEPWGLAPPGPGERACGHTRAVGEW